MKAKNPVLIHAALLTLGFICILPLLWMLSTALKPIEQTMSNPPVWIPPKPQFGNFIEAMKYGSADLGYYPFPRYAMNTLLITVLSVCGAVFSNSLVAYSFARLKWPGRDLFFTLTLATMMVPFPILMVPTFGLHGTEDFH